MLFLGVTVLVPLELFGSLILDLGPQVDYLGNHLAHLGFLYAYLPFKKSLLVFP